MNDDSVTTTLGHDTFRIGGDLEVRRLGFGTMRLTGKGIWGQPSDPAECRRVLQRAVSLGINFLDTADAYGPEVAEHLIAEALHPYPSDLVIATKGGFTRPGPDQWVEDGRPAYLRKACDASLRRLRLERIDLYQLHRIDPKVPADEQIDTLKALQAEGKIRHIGLSEVTVAQIEHARKLVSIVTVQNRYSLSDRDYEPVVEYCTRERLGFIPWYPLGAGTLTAAGGSVARIADRLGITVSQLALAWLLQRSPVMLPIPGTSKVEHLDENFAAAVVRLDDQAMRDLDRAVVSARRA